MYNNIVNKYAGMTPGEIESAKRANETPEQTRKRHERERQAAIIEGEEARRQEELARLRGGWGNPFKNPFIWTMEDEIRPPTTTISCKTDLDMKVLYA